MDFALYKKTNEEVKILGMENEMFHIEFSNGACILVSEKELIFI